MSFRISFLLFVSFAVGCADDKTDSENEHNSSNSKRGDARSTETSFNTTELSVARKGFQTRLAERGPRAANIMRPARTYFRLVYYKSSVGNLGAYLSPDPNDGRRHPAIIWITGGDCNSIGDVWTRQGDENDQSAAAYRREGVIMMFPSLRGGNGNPGRRESFFGEVDDVIAAAKNLSTVSYVDPRRIYLGGHSTGGTLALLTAECTDRFRAVFAFGPVADVRDYGGEHVHFDTTDEREFELRAPRLWLKSVRTPVFVIEGAAGNIHSLRELQDASDNPQLRFLAVQGADHFTVLAPVNRAIARKLLSDTGPKCSLSITEEELSRLFSQ